MAANVIGRVLVRSVGNRSHRFLSGARLIERIPIQIPQLWAAAPSARLLPVPSCHRRYLFTSCCLQEEAEEANEDETKNEEGEEEGDEAGSAKSGIIRRFVDVDTSIKYMKSEAFKITYGDSLVWESYRRNFKGPKPRRKTRKTCIRNGVLSTGNPCPICRDEYLTIHPKNVELLKQFVSPQTGLVLSYEKTGVCQKQYKNLLIAVHQAWDLGYLEMPLPHRRYNYADYYPEYQKKVQQKKTS